MARAALRLALAAASLQWATGTRAAGHQEVRQDDDSFRVFEPDQARERPKKSIFCFALILPGGNEQELLTMQFKEHKSVFACNETRVYSNVTVDLDGFNTSLVKSDLVSPKGGRWNTALNTKVFQKVWDSVIDGGRWRFYEWTVKADPDAVFFPERLVDVLWRPEVDATRSALGSDMGVYIKNCGQDLHGPLEVLSWKAVDALSRSRYSCTWHDQEDWWLGDCLQTLGLQSIDVADLLSDTSCPPLDSSCEGSRVAFHPFKTVQDFNECWRRAHDAGTWKK